MSIIFDSLILILLFVVLGISANIVVRKIKYIASILKIRLFGMGIILGLITTLPELSLGINAAVDKATSLSAGNLIGGLMVLFGLILGISLILNRKIVTDGNLKILIPQILIIFSPLLLGLDGSYGLLDGLMMILFYLAIIYYLFRINKTHDAPVHTLIDRNRIRKAILLSITGIVFVMLASHWIIKITLDLLQYVNISKLVIGALVFSIGTNLPELTIAFTSWREKASELSLSHLTSSALSNVLVLGILASIRPIYFTIGTVYCLLVFFIALVLMFFVFFYHSDNKMDRKEGIILLFIYILFMIGISVATS